MAEHAYTIGGGCLPPLPPDLDRHPDGALLRVCAALERLRAITDEMEQIAAGIPARTVLGRRMKAPAL
jgi:hypothetical protein